MPTTFPPAEVRDAATIFMEAAQPDLEAAPYWIYSSKPFILHYFISSFLNAGSESFHSGRFISSSIRNRVH